MTQECDIDKINRLLSDLQSQLNDIPLSKKDTIKNNEQRDETQSEEKRQSWWVWVRGKFRKFYKLKNEAANLASDSGGSQGGSSRRNRLSINKYQEEADMEIQKLMNDIRQMKTAFDNLNKFQTEMSKSLELFFPSNKLNAIRYSSHDLKEFRRKIVNLRSQIPSLLLKQSSRGLSITDSQTAEENSKINEIGNDMYLPGLHISEDFKNSSAFEEIVEKFQGLDFTQKLCLLSFAVFPENRAVKRTMLMYWWIGEGFLVSDDSENSVTRILDDFSTKGLLEPVEGERKLKPNTYKMEPHVHAVVISLAKCVDLFDLYNSNGELIMKKSLKQNVCLVRGSSLLPQAKASVMQPRNLKTIFNSTERYPDFTFKWFHMDSLRVLYLGRWERTAKRHIEVESTEFLWSMRFLKNLRLLSFQGISRIEKLNNSICVLPKLVILDLKACYNLEVLPEDISLLENLIYLDVSECFMLDRMPKGVAQLSRLQVLKGFVISESDDERNCAIKHLESLRKLSITVNKYLFEVENLMESLKGLKQLESLKIAWGARFCEDDQKGETSKRTNNEAEENIENEEKVNQRDASVEKKLEDLKEQEDEQVRKEGHTSVEKKGETGKQEMGPEDGVKNEMANLEEKQDEVKAESLKSDKIVEGEKKTSPSQDATETVQNKPDDQKGESKVEEEGDSGKGKAKVEEGKTLDEIEKENSSFEMKASVSRETTEKVVEGDGVKENDDLVEGKKHDEVEAKRLESDNGVEEVKKASPSQESTDETKNMPDDHQRDDKQEEEKGDEEKEKPNLEEGKKKDEVKAAESTKLDRVIEGDEKTSPPQESKDTTQSKPDDHNENDKMQEKKTGKKNGADLKNLDEGEAKTQKSDKTIKFGKKVSFSENSIALIEKKPDNLKRDNAMAKEIHETPSSPSRHPKESRSHKLKLLKAMRSETKKWGKHYQQTTKIDKLPSTLKKLELECFPGKNPPGWLNPKNLDNLEKLSIKGGNLSRISDEIQPAENNSRVQILRLKYLHEFKAEWKDLQALFPKLRLLEKYQCPKVAFCPTDGNGVWKLQSPTSENV